MSSIVAKITSKRFFLTGDSSVLISTNVGAKAEGILLNSPTHGSKVCRVESVKGKSSSEGVGLQPVFCVPRWEYKCRCGHIQCGNLAA